MGLFRREISDEDRKRATRLVRECQNMAQAMNTCVQPKVFFETYDALVLHLKELTGFEKYRIFKGNLPSRDLHQLEDREQSEINAMIQRSFVHVRDGVAGEKTARRQAAFSAYFEDLEGYLSRMNRFNRNVVRDLRKIVMEAEE